MQLKDKIAVIHGGGGALGGAAAWAFAREGARVFLAGRTPARLDAVAREIAAAGGQVETDLVDALDEAAVERHADAVAARAGRIDILLNAVGIPHLQGVGLAELAYEDFAAPLHGYTRTLFLTAKAAARRMRPNGSGVILSLSTPGGRMPAAKVLGYGAACSAVESMTRHLAGDLGAHGIRAVCLRSHAIPESLAKGSYVTATFQTMADEKGMGWARCWRPGARAGP
jgi:NAD(P)-dependent dehydrogenase (short-subunit alcohol dehydrogenase family)